MKRRIDDFNKQRPNFIAKENETKTKRKESAREAVLFPFSIQCNFTTNPEAHASTDFMPLP